MRIVTHNGHFHTDDILAVSALLMKFPGAEVVRSRDEEIIKAADIAVDVGQVYDPAKRRFDHHQKEGAGKRGNGIPYASFGLVWKEFGEELAGGKEEAQIIDEVLAAGVDAVDNGVNLYDLKFGNVREYSLGDFFDCFNDGARILEDFDRAFFSLLPIAQDLLKREIVKAQATVADWREVREIYNSSPDKRLVVLPKQMHWKKVLIDSEALFVVYPRPEGKWGAQSVPKDPQSFELKKKFPEEVPGALFRHRDGFLIVAASKEDVVKCAQIALNS